MIYSIRYVSWCYFEKPWLDLWNFLQGLPRQNRKQLVEKQAMWRSRIPQWQLRARFQVSYNSEIEGLCLAVSVFLWPWDMVGAVEGSWADECKDLSEVISVLPSERVHDHQKCMPLLLSTWVWFTFIYFILLGLHYEWKVQPLMNHVGLLPLGLAYLFWIFNICSKINFIVQM